MYVVILNGVQSEKGCLLSSSTIKSFLLDYSCSVLLSFIIKFLEMIVHEINNFASCGHRTTLYMCTADKLSLIPNNWLLLFLFHQLRSWGTMQIFPSSLTLICEVAILKALLTSISARALLPVGERYYQYTLSAYTMNTHFFLFAKYSLAWTLWTEAELVAVAMQWCSWINVRIKGLNVWLRLHLYQYSSCSGNCRLTTLLQDFNVCHLILIVVNDIAW